MASPSRPDDPPVRRHDLVAVGAAGWRSLLAARDDLAAEPLVVRWADHGWPLVGRRAGRGERHGVALGLPLPPAAGKRRLAVLVRPQDIVSTEPPPALRAVVRAAPRAWWQTLERLDGLAARHALQARVFGSLAWQAITGLDYLTERSDLDLLIAVRQGTDLASLAADLAAIEAAAPMRLDGELVRGDGAAVNWREFRAGPRDVLVKTVRGVALIETSLFLRGGTSA